jgi:hypothetical protein
MNQRPAMQISGVAAFVAILSASLLTLFLVLHAFGSCHANVDTSPDNPNQWGDPDNTGALCLNVSCFHLIISSLSQFSLSGHKLWTR